MLTLIAQLQIKHVCICSLQCDNIKPILLVCLHEQLETQLDKILVIVTKVPWSYSTVEFFEELIINIRRGLTLIPTLEPTT